MQAIRNIPGKKVTYNYYHLTIERSNILEKLDPYESLGFYCPLTLKSFIESLEENPGVTGISPTQFIALAHLGPICQDALTVKIIDRLERDKRVVRKASPDDGRVELVASTRNSLRIWDELSKAGRTVIDKAYRGIHPPVFRLSKDFVYPLILSLL